MRSTFLRLTAITGFCAATALLGACAGDARTSSTGSSI